MGTRAIIKVVGSDVELYRHSDGYPEGKHGVLALLQPFVDKFRAERGDDAAYFMARLVQHSCNQYDADIQSPGPHYIGFGLFSKQEEFRDAAYFYTVDLSTGKIAVKG